MPIDLNINESIYYDQTGRENLIVTFGGIKGKLPIPLFEFWNSLEEINVDKVFIRDCSQCWYQEGFLHHTSSIEDSLQLLENIIKRYNYKQVLFIGNSAGGYAAILFGVQLSISNILAFAPQTFIGKWNRFIYRDTRWSEEISRAQRAKKTEYFDLKNILTKNRNTNIKVFYSAQETLDAIHANRLSRFKNVKLYNIHGGGHNVIKILRDQGELMNLIKEGVGL